MENERKVIIVKDTNFIYTINFAGDPERDNFGSDARQANLIIPEDLANELSEEGFNVKVAPPKEEGDAPIYFVNIKANYNSNWPPSIYLVTNGIENLLDEDTIKCLDNRRRVRIDHVKVALNVYENTKRGTKSLYIREMHVYQDTTSDPMNDDPMFDYYN